MLSAFATGIAVAWLVEAQTAGRGPISKYLAPFAIGAILVSSILSIAQAIKRQRRNDNDPRRVQ